MSAPVVSFVLGSYNRRALLRSTIASLRAVGGPGATRSSWWTAGSTDGDVAAYAPEDVLTFHAAQPGLLARAARERRSWGAFMNLGFRAPGRFVCMVFRRRLLVPGSLAAA
jgi:hypothetical protein